MTRDVTALARFYEKLTGIVPDGSDEYVEFDIAGNGIAICSQRSADMFNGGAATAAANRSVILDFQVEDVDRERARLGDFIEEFVLEPVDQPWGNRSMIFKDPDGNLINFYTVIQHESGTCGLNKEGK
ncbi:MAG TPA: VOC family protein [Candidatus Acidoferrum sp.]|nr:VOC family protein [Candidatus Acidoferrum sp.]